MSDELNGENTPDASTTQRFGPDFKEQLAGLEGGLSQEAHVEEAEQTKARQVCQTAVACVRLKRLLLPKDTAVAFVANPLCCV